MQADHPDVHLHAWCKTQRVANNGKGALATYNVCAMTELRREKLNRINFCWDVYENDWQEQFERLKKFEKKNGHVRVKNDLYRWVENQRRCYRRYILTKKGIFVKYNHRIKLLEDIGIDLDPSNMLNE